jgi:ATP-dependent Clp protease ATP-binding subunit ClpC
VDDVFDALSRRVIGQEPACRLAAEMIATYKAGLNDPQRPVGVLLFCGPTGVGKTELAKGVSKYLFGHGDETNRLIRIDCSEYAGFGAAERLLTKPDGTPGLLIERVRRQPFVVVLFDEIEKASDDVFDTLLNLLEEGRLTDRFGRTTFFRSALVAMTSNLGVRRGASLGFLDGQEPNYERAILDRFRPEFVNRLDAIVPFVPLPRDVILRIARKELAEIADREGLAAAQLRLTFGDRLIERVADRGFDPRLGARPLQRFLEESVVRALSQYLVANPELRRRSLHLEALENGEILIASSE